MEFNLLYRDEALHGDLPGDVDCHVFLGGTG